MLSLLDEPRRGWAVALMAACMVLAACELDTVDESKSEKDPSDAGGANAPGFLDAGPDAAQAPTEDAASAGPDAAADATTGVLKPPTPTRCSLDEGSLEPATAWSGDWDFHNDDPEGDDKGMGTYTYPQDVLEGAADIRGVTLHYDASAQRLDVKVAITKLVPESRVGLVFWDRPSFDAELAKTGIDWALGGVELRVPDWAKSGIAMTLSIPKADNPLYDWTVSNAGGWRADNAVYTQTHNDAFENWTEWIDCSGRATDDVSEIMELDVVADVESTPNTLSFSLPVAAIMHFVDVTAGEMALTAYGFLVVAQPGVTAGSPKDTANEFGSYEVTAEVGGIAKGAEKTDNGWRDPDAYDVAFVSLVDGDTDLDVAAKQNRLLSPPAPMGTIDFNTNIVTLTKAGAGVAFMETGGVKE